MSDNKNFIFKVVDCGCQPIPGARVTLYPILTCDPPCLTEELKRIIRKRSSKDGSVTILNPKPQKYNIIVKTRHSVMILKVDLNTEQPWILEKVCIESRFA